MNRERLAARMAQRLRERQWTLSVAESCTGGSLGARITSIPGVSDVFLGGVIAYHNRIKHALLDVPQEVIESHGAVSAPVAEAMARGCRLRFAASVSVAITGIAGPAGGTSDKPVGLVFLAVASPDAVRVERCVFSGDRSKIQASAVDMALQLLLEAAGEGE